MFGFRKRYEYKMLTSKDPMTTVPTLQNERSHIFDNSNVTLDGMGGNGWELIGVILNMKTMEYVYHFKRTI